MVDRNHRLPRHAQLSSLRQPPAGLFVVDDGRRRPRRPLATLLIASAASAVAVYQLQLDPQHQADFIVNWGAIPAQYSMPDGLRAFLRNDAIRLWSALLVHANWWHVLGNLAFFVSFALHTERRIGSLNLLLLYFGAGALANVITGLLLGDRNVVIIGASGAVSAVAGAYFALFPDRHLGLMLPLGLYLQFVRVPATALLGTWLLLQLLYTFFGPAFGSVAWAAHLTGFICGALYARLYSPTKALRTRRINAHRS